MILVTGGTGMVGGDVVRLLSRQGVAARALVRNPQKAPDLPGITWVTGDLAKPETLRAAFAGADTLFLVSTIGEDTVALQHNAIVAARDAGVGHIVKLSAFGASSHSKAPICLWHHQIEQEMQASGMDWTILRPHHFMQNLLTQTQYIINDGVVYSASGDGKIPLHRCPGHCRSRRCHADETRTPGQKIRDHRRRGAVLPPGNGDHQQDDRQAAPFHRRVAGRCTGASTARGLSAGHPRKRSRHRGLSASRRKNGDDHQRGRRPDRPAAAYLPRIRTGSCAHVPWLARQQGMIASGSDVPGFLLCPMSGCGAEQPIPECPLHVRSCGVKQTRYAQSEFFGS